MRNRLCSSCGVTNAATAHECKGCGTRFRSAPAADSSKDDGIDRQCAWEDYGQRCELRGVVSDATTGDGPWWCREHNAKRLGRQAPRPYPPPRDLTSYGLNPKPGEADFASRASKGMRQQIIAIGQAIPLGRNRQWAVRILDRWADGEAVPDIAVQMACDALGQDYDALKASRASAEARPTLTYRPVEEPA